MRTFGILWRRELASLLLSPVAYIVTFVFLLVTGLGFWLVVAALAQGVPARAGLSELLGWFFLVTLPVLAPVLTMRLFAEERRAGTFESLMTAPVTETQVVLAKYAGALTFYALMWVPTLLYGPILRLFAPDAPAADPGTLAGLYAGAMTLGAFFLALGLMASALTRSQVSAALAGFAMIALVVLAGVAPYVWHTELGDRLGPYVCPVVHMGDFSRGVFDTRALAFHGIGAALALFVTVRIVEARRWA